MKNNKRWAAVLAGALLGSALVGQADAAYLSGDPETPACGQADVLTTICNSVHSTEESTSSTRDALVGSDGNIVVDGVTFTLTPIFEDAVLNSVITTRELSADGCNNNVCIYVTGKGRRVTEWKTDALQFPSDGCVTPGVRWDIRSGSITTKFHGARWRYPCHSVPPGARATLWNASVPGYKMPAIFGDGHELCNFWNFRNGYPCILIKA